MSDLAAPYFPPGKEHNLNPRRDLEIPLAHDQHPVQDCFGHAHLQDLGVNHATPPVPYDSHFIGTITIGGGPGPGDGTEVLLVEDLPQNGVYEFAFAFSLTGTAGSWALVCCEQYRNDVKEGVNRFQPTQADVLKGYPLDGGAVGTTRDVTVSGSAHRVHLIENKNAIAVGYVKPASSAAAAGSIDIWMRRIR